MISYIGLIKSLLMTSKEKNVILFIFSDLVEFKGWHIFGNAKPDLKEALQPMGATFQSYFFGFNHSIKSS